VFLGAGVRTVNDRELVWRDPDHVPELVPPPRFERGAAGSRQHPQNPRLYEAAKQVVPSGVAP